MSDWSAGLGGWGKGTDVEIFGKCTWSDSVTNCEGWGYNGRIEKEECISDNFQVPVLDDLMYNEL